MQLSVWIVLTHSHLSSNRLGVKRLVVFIQTHSHPENGDLHCKEGGALKVADVGVAQSPPSSFRHYMLLVFPGSSNAGAEQLREPVPFNHVSTSLRWGLDMRLCSRIPLSICSIVRFLFLMGTSKVTNSATIRKHFKYTIGYTSHTFLPQHATSFSMKLCQKLFIECFSVIRALPDLLKEEEGLGAHTGVVLLSNSIGVRYFWCHTSIRPCGDIIALQCPKCYALRTLKFSAGESSGTYRAECRCRWSKDFVAQISPALYPPGGNGWGRQMLYGTEADFQRVWNAPRNMYDTSL